MASRHQGGHVVWTAVALALVSAVARLLLTKLLGSTRSGIEDMIRLRDATHLIYSAVYPYAVDVDSKIGFPEDMYNTSDWSKINGRNRRFYFYTKDKMLQFVVKWSGYTG